MDGLLKKIVAFIKNFGDIFLISCYHPKRGLSMSSASKDKMPLLRMNPMGRSDAIAAGYAAPGANGTWTNLIAGGATSDSALAHLGYVEFYDTVAATDIRIPTVKN